MNSSIHQAMTTHPRRCTWLHCEMPAVQQQWDRQGKPWADLCQAHNDEMCSAMISSDVKRIVSSWAKAQTGDAARLGGEAAIKLLAMLRDNVKSDNQPR